MPKDLWRKANNRAKYGRAEKTPEHAKKHRPKAQRGYTCPKCGKGMVVRFNRLSGEPFMGCERYPKCAGTLATTDGNATREPKAAAPNAGAITIPAGTTVEVKRIGASVGWTEHRVKAEMRFGDHQASDHGHAWLIEHLGFIIRVEKALTV